nr:hypothetical protein CFP56_29446 [Quercus suber]
MHVGKTHVTEEAPVQDTTTSQVGPDEKSFGLWVLVARNRKPGKKMSKVPEPLAQSVLPAQNPARSTSDLSSPTCPPFSGLNTNKRPPTSLTVSADGDLCLEKSISALRSDQPKVNGFTPKSKSFGRIQKAKLSQTGKYTQKVHRQTPLTEWKSVISKPFKANVSLAFEMKKPNGRNSEITFEGFSAGGSKLAGSPSAKPVIGDMDGDQGVAGSSIGSAHEMQPIQDWFMVRWLIARWRKVI